MRTKQYIPWIIGGIFLIVLINLPSLLLHNATNVRLSSTSVLTGQVAQALSTNNHDKVPIYGKDFSITGIHYFDSNTWVITEVKSSTLNGDLASIVFQKQDGVFVPVLGPGTAFDSSYVDNLPSDVAAYLRQNGVVYESN